MCFAVFSLLGAFFKLGEVFRDSLQLELSAFFNFFSPKTAAKALL